MPPGKEMPAPGNVAWKPGVGRIVAGDGRAGRPPPPGPSTVPAIAPIGPGTERRIVEPTLPRNEKNPGSPWIFPDTPEW